MMKKSTKENVFVKILRVILIILLLPLLLIRAIVLSVKNSKKRKNLLKSVKIMQISQIDGLEGAEFENFLCLLFEQMGYNVSQTKATGDYGADLVVTRGKAKYVVQAKRYSKTVGVHAVQEVMGAKKHYGASGAMVATNNFFSNEAIVLAAENDIILIDRKVLQNLISKYQVEILRKKCKFCATTELAVKQIEERYAYWI